MEIKKRIIDGKLIIASHNKGKVKEISEILKPFSIDCISAEKVGLPEPHENGSTFEENSRIKALSASSHSQQISLSDDSGLCVNALGGEPGIFSARWAGPDKDFSKASRLIEEKLLNKNNFAAKFVCVLTLAWPDMYSETFRGEVNGRLTFPPKGNNGFGYDPIFIPRDHKYTFGQMKYSKKLKIDHRYKAFKKIKKFF
mgnify:CR=1 FL=1